MNTPTDVLLNYLSTQNAWNLWNLFLLGLARVVPAIALSPFFGIKTLTDPVKLGMSIFVTFLFFPLYVSHPPPHLDFDIIYIVYLIKELFVGGLIGFMFVLPFHAAQGAGILIDHQRGASSLQVHDPTTQSAASPIGQLYNFTTIVFFFIVGGPFFFFDALVQSYTLIPIGPAFAPSFFIHTNPLWHTILTFITQLLTIALQLAAPALIALLMTDLFLGIVNRMAPQVQITFLLWSLKAFVGILLLWASWWLVLRQIDHQIISLGKGISHLFATLPPIK